MDTRVALFLFSIAVVILALSSAFIIGMSTSVARPRPTVYSPSFLWDFYTPELGYEARITSYRATRSYLRRHHFIIPFNLVELLFVLLPRLLVFRSYPRSQLARLATLVWKVTVWPCLLMSFLICWPLLV
jgi:hypothetical protein